MCKRASESCGTSGRVLVSLLQYATSAVPTPEFVKSGPVTLCVESDETRGHAHRLTHHYKPANLVLSLLSSRLVDIHTLVYCSSPQHDSRTDTRRLFIHLSTCSSIEHFPITFKNVIVHVNFCFEIFVSFIFQ